MANALKTQGTQFYMVDTATTSIEIGNIQSFNPPSPQSDEIEITALTSTAKEFLQGLIDYGEASFEINLDPLVAANHRQLFTKLAAGTTQECLVGLSDGTTAAPSVVASAFGALPATRSWIKFTGFIKAIPIQGSTNSTMKATVTVRVSGSPTYSWKT